MAKSIPSGGRRKRQPAQFSARCRKCKIERLPEELFWRGLCDECRAAKATATRKRVGTRALSKAKDGGTVERDGQQYRVVVLPPKRPRRKRR